MVLSNYHQKYSSLPDEEIAKRANEKRIELVEIFNRLSLSSDSTPIRIAVLGCGDKRFVKHHKDIFQNLLQKPVELTTFDISVDHLNDEEDIIQHDCTLPISNPPYDITFAHVLLKFIETEKQWELIKNSIDALKNGGLAIHVLDKEDYETEGTLLANGQYVVPLERWKQKIKKLGLECKEIPIKYGLALVIQK
ncbi:MAG: hypothetical protein A2017_17610 [Lentisphaerae bacterium GWF2_44_16]|nr:MAG: hypothetical protein A2017_17610 [Lentisphaerae bacterium GWF2_44_16]HAU65828.1 hypothetical protein [Candidatus Uhrbacteria bacterium]